eukprot:206524-Chlamydomonas_euryale.AAC.3
MRFARRITQGAQARRSAVAAVAAAAAAVTMQGADHDVDRVGCGPRTELRGQLLPWQVDEEPVEGIVRNSGAAAGRTAAMSAGCCCRSRSDLFPKEAERKQVVLQRRQQLRVYARPAAAVAAASQQLLHEPLLRVAHHHSRGLAPRAEAAAARARLTHALRRRLRRSGALGVRRRARLCACLDGAPQAAVLPQGVCDGAGGKPLAPGSLSGHGVG